MIESVGSKWKTGIAVLSKEEDGDDVIVKCWHLCLYEVEDPTDQLESLKKELKEDPDFKDTTNWDDKTYLVIKEDILEGFMKWMNIIL